MGLHLDYVCRLYNCAIVCRAFQFDWSKLWRCSRKKVDVLCFSLFGKQDYSSLNQFHWQIMNAFDQRMTYYEIFTIGNAYCLVMKKKSAISWLQKPIPIVENLWIDFSICLNCNLFVDLSITINPFLTKPYENFI